MPARRCCTGPNWNATSRCARSARSHMPLSARTRLEHFLDPGEQREIAADLEPLDPLKFRDSKKYRDRITAAQKKTGEKDALVAMAGKLAGRDIVACAFEFGFMGGSMGSVVGEKVRPCRPGEPAPAGAAGLFFGHRRRAHAGRPAVPDADGQDQRRAGPLGGGGHSLHFGLTHPTTGGVSASLGMLGDVNIAEPGALIGFAGPRVIEQTVREKLPEGFQRSEFLLEKGAIDMIVDRRQMREQIAALLSLLTGGERPRPVRGEIVSI